MNDKQSIIRSITLMAIMAAINIIFILLANFVPYLLFLLVFFLPMTSMLVTIRCRKYLFPAYMLVTIGLSILASMSDFTVLFFYVIPALIVGFILGIAIEKKAPPIFTIFCIAVIYVGCTYLSNVVFKAMFGTDLIWNMVKLLKLDSFAYINEIIPSAILFISLGQTVICYAVVLSQAKKFKIEVSENISDKYVYISAAILLFTSIICAFFSLAASIFLLLSFVYFSIYLLVKLIILQNKLIYILLGVSLIAGFLIFGLCYKMIPERRGFLLIGLFFLFVYIISITNYLLVNRKNKIE